MKYLYLDPVTAQPSFEKDLSYSPEGVAVVGGQKIILPLQVQEVGAYNVMTQKVNHAGYDIFAEYAVKKFEIVDLSQEEATAIISSLIISRRQAFLAMAAAGVLTTIRGYMNSLEELDPARITWETAVEFHRNDQMINSLAPLLNLTSAQIDDLFVLGFSL